MPISARLSCFFALIVALAIIKASVRILREYERAVVFTLGRFQKVKGHGLVLLIPFFQEMVRVDLRIQVIEIPSQYSSCIFLAAAMTEIEGAEGR
jgi:regulator of protease activity HflC (stomatin/prohibitin superfamily)